MANIIDALVVTLGLDASGFLRGKRQTEEASGKLREQITSDNARQSDATKKFQDGLRSVKTEVLGLALAFAGASSLKGFASGILTNDAALGRMATTLGVASDKLYAWQQAVQSVGGSREDANSTFSALSKTYQDYQLRGDLSKRGDLAGLGLNYSDLKDPEQALLKLASASQRFSAPEFNSRASALGIDQNTINLLRQGRPALEAYLETARRNAPTEEDIKRSQDFQKALADIRGAFEKLAQPAVTQFAGIIVSMANAAKDAKTPFDALTRSLGALADQLGFTTARGKIWADVQQAWALIRNGNIRAGLAMLKQAGDEPLFGGGASSGGGGGWMADQRASVDRYAAGGGASASGAAGGVEAFFRGRGFTAEQARGIAAGLHSESGLNPNAFNAAGGGNGAFGIAQWRGGRQAELFRRYGRRPTLQQQLEFVAWELNGGHPGGRAVRGAQGADDTLRAFIRSYEIPSRPGGADELADLRRGRRYLGGNPRALAGTTGGGGAGNSTTIGTIVINTAATDAKGIQRDLSADMRRRGVIFQTQSGVQP
jgi:hypothetical protein